MKRLSLFLFLCCSFFSLPDMHSAEGHSARCTGSRNCRACTNCSRCQHCRGGGTCGVCVGDVVEEKPAVILRLPRRSESPAPAPKPTPTPTPKESLAPVCDTFTGRVVAIADGDTLTVLDESNQQRKIRIQGIDAPEKGQAFGTVSQRNLSALVFGKQVSVECGKLDRYQRLVAKVWVNGADVGYTQVRDGLAWHYKQYQKEQSKMDQQLYDAAEIKARRDQKGLWVDAQPKAPWEFRKE